MSRSISRRACAAVVGALVALAPLGAAQAAPGAPDARDPSSERSSRQAPAPLLTPSGETVEGQYVVVFEKGTAGRSVNRARDNAQRDGATVVQSYGTALQGFAAQLPEQALRGLRNNPHVAFIEPDVEMSVADTQSPATWGIDRIDQRNRPLDNSYTYNASGQGVTTYVIDTGIRTAHAEFSGRARGGYTAINDGRGAEDCNGHGTHVAGTVGGETYGVAQDVALVAVRVLGCNGSGTNSGVIAGVDWVTANHSGPSVANMSLGGGNSSALDTAVRNSIASGVTYSLAAGNDNADACNGSPNRVAEGLTVGSTTSSDQRSSFSNYGTCVDLFAPGSSITSAWYTSNTATNTISGTSMAAPHVAGAAALYLEGSPSASPSQVNSAITGSATPNVLSGIGSGSPNLLLYSLLSDAPAPDPDPACSLPETETGSLSGTGDYAYHSGSSGYYYSGSGTHVGCLEGPSGTDFDLYLEKWNGSSWVRVAQSISSSSSEQITYSGTSGYYSWVVDFYSGSGSYTFGLDRP